MVTGNLIQIGRSIEKMIFARYFKNSLEYWADILIRNIIVDIACGFIGPLLCCYLKKQVRYRENSFAIIVSLYFLSFFLMIMTIYSTREEFENELAALGKSVDDTIISQEVLVAKGHTYNTLAVALMGLTRFKIIHNT